LYFCTTHRLVPQKGSGATSSETGISGPRVCLERGPVDTQRGSGACLLAKVPIWLIRVVEAVLFLLLNVMVIKAKAVVLSRGFSSVSPLIGAERLACKFVLVWYRVGGGTAGGVRPPKYLASSWARQPYTGRAGVETGGVLRGHLICTSHRITRRDYDNTGTTRTTGWHRWGTQLLVLAATQGAAAKQLRYHGATRKFFATMSAAPRLPSSFSNSNFPFPLARL
jgi:hypothetical protein